MFSCNRTVAVLVACSCIWTSSPLAGESDDGVLAYYSDDPDFISLVTGSRQPLKDAPAVASVITARQIKTAGATTLDQVLEMVPGLHVARSQVRLDAVYSLRGFFATFSPGVLMMVNGVGIDTAFFGSRFAGFRLPVAAIDRVEVIRGPASALYGADAFVGVINIVTRDGGAIDGTEFGARGGSFDTQGAWAQHGGKLGKLDLAMTAEWQHTAGDKNRRVSSDIQTVLDGWFGTSASNAPGPLDTGYSLLDTRIELGSDAWKLRFWNWKTDKSGYGPGVGQALNSNSYVDNDTYMIDVDYRPKPHGPWEFETRASHLYWWSYYDLELLPPGTMVPVGSDGNLFTTGGGSVTFPDGVITTLYGFERHYSLDTSAVYSGMRDHRWRLAAGASRKEFETQAAANYGPGVLDGSNFTAVKDGSLVDLTGTANVWAPDKNRTLSYVSLQDEWRFAPDWAATVGGRYDYYSDFGGTFNPRLALVWQTSYDLTSKLLYGRAFRPPAFVELYPQNNPVQRGNPDLDPEIIDTVEWVFDYAPPSNWSTSVNVYAYDADNLIRFVPDNFNNRIIAQNAAGQRGYGFELEGKWRLRPDLKLGATLGWVRAVDSDTGKRIADIPRYQAQTFVDWNPSEHYSLFGQATYIGGRERSAGDPRPNVSDFTVVDLTVRYTPTGDGWDTALLLRNVFDAAVFEPSPGDTGMPGGSAIPDDYPMEGRSAMLEFRVRF